MTEHEIDVEVAKVAKEDGWELPDANLIEFGRKVWLRRLGASGVDVEGLAREIYSALVTNAGDRQEGYPDLDEFEWITAAGEIIRKHIAQPAALSWKLLPELPEEDTPVLIAVMTEVDDHGTGEWVKVPETARGTIYSHPNGVTADTDCGEFNDEEILGWQPLPVPPKTGKQEERRDG